MDRKKIYIIVIVLCLVVTAGVLYYGFFSQPSVEAPPGITPIATDIDAARQSTQATGAKNTAGLPSPDEATEFAPPRIFPQDTNLDLNVYSSARFNSLQDYVPLTVAPEEIGRDNPFAPYQ